MVESRPRVFISYAWEDDGYRLWVKRLAARLRDDGVNARLDAWHLEAGDNVPDFMTRECRLADRILVLCSPAYRAKVHATEERQRVAGVGWEARLISGQLWAAEQNKAVLALASGGWADAAPDLLRMQVYVDLSQPQSFEAGYRQLLRELTATTEKEPPLGALPAGLEPAPVAPLRGAEAASPAGGDLDLDFLLRPALAGGWSVELRADGGAVLAAPLELGAAEGSSQLQQRLLAIHDNRCDAEDIQYVGAELWTRLLAGPLEREFDRARQLCRSRPDAILNVRLRLPAELEDLPWETVWDLDEFSLATSPKSSVVRWPARSEEMARPAARPAGGPRMLVVFPSGSDLAACGEWERIRRSVEAAAVGAQLEILDGQVSANRLAQALASGWDIVHFIGHGRVEGGQVELRFNGEDAGPAEDWVSARLFAQQFLRFPPRLVVLNCCHGGVVEPEGLCGLGGYLTRARVPAVLLMRYAIRDNVAADFSGAFYRELLGGSQPGRVDLAVQEGRAVLQRTYRDNERARSYVTPVLYLASHEERLFALPEKRARAAAAGDRAIDERIDPRLLYALKSRSCLPILGPGILGAGAERDAAIPPGPVGMATRLAKLPEFQQFERVAALAESVAEWLTPLVFERICQHYESTPGQRHALNQAVREVYRALQPPAPLARVADWPVPGIVYTFVDGLLEESLRHRRGRNLRVVHAEEAAKASTPSGDELVLVNLRGTWATTGPVAPMILTEEDEDRVFDQMPGIAKFVADIMNGVGGGCTLLFLGTSPRDPLVRALARQLLRPELARSRGSAFFAAAEVSAADRSYWQQFQKLEWLEIDSESLIAGLSTAGRSAEPRP